jgi:hypothetical protein
VRVIFQAPRFASFSCDDCERWLHTDGVFSERGRYPLRVRVERPKGMLTPCRAPCPKIPFDAPEKTRRYAVELSERGWRVWTHYRECAAVGQFPDDPLVRRHASLLRQVIDSVAEGKVEQRQSLLMSVIVQLAAR